MEDNNKPKVLILVGGNGERFFPFTSIIPKCLIPVGGKPCVRWIVEDAINQGFNKVVLCTSKKNHENFSYEFRDLNIEYSVNCTTNGTVGELLCAKSFIDDTFILRYGDDLTDISYNDLFQFHREKKADVTLAFTTEYKVPVGVIRVSKSGKVMHMLEKPRLGKPSWIGVAIMEPKVLNYFVPGQDVAGNVIPKLLEAQQRVFAFGTKSEWYDVGNIEHWRKADEYFRANQKV